MVVRPDAMFQTGPWDVLQIGYTADLNFEGVLWNSLLNLRLIIGF